MSNQSDVSEIVIGYQSFITSNYCAVAAIGLYLYECVITGVEEVHYFWRGKWTGANVLFFWNRIIFLFTLVYSTYTSFGPIADKSCDAVVKVGVVAFLLPYVPWAAFSSLRAFALSRSWILASVIFLLSMVPFCGSLTEFRFNIGGVVDPMFGCLGFDTESEHTFKMLTIATRISVITADVLLILVTWIKFPRGSRLPEQSFGYVLYRDGTIYFVSLLLLNVMHLVLTVVEVEDPYSNVLSFTQPLTTILVSRFLLNLQAANAKAVDHTSSSGRLSQPGAPGTESLVFERVIGSLGSGLVPDADILDDVDYAEESASDSNTAGASSGPARRIQTGLEEESSESAEVGRQIVSSRVVDTIA
ncbi:hypothetical protein C8Q74DRAFT_1442691 [Fomes fomentarius]|nr:hypothetical protein C8Q74DRAFT_1442691 [Fomes fomentarius]